MTMLVAAIAATCLAPWAVYLGGIAKFTDMVGSAPSEWVKQEAYMLEWYEVSMQFFIFVVLAVMAAGGMTKKAGFMHMFLATNTALIIYSATSRIIQATRNDVGGGDALAAIRCMAAGQVSTAFWNFLMAIALGLAAGEDAHPAREAAKDATAA